MSTQADLDLASLAGSAESDPTLGLILAAAQGGLSMPMTLIIDGFLVTGLLGRDEQWASVLDERVEYLISAAEEHHRRNSEGGQVPKDQAAAFKALREHTTQQAVRRLSEKREKHRSEIESHIPEGDEWKPTDLPDDLGALYARMNAREQRYVTLAQASIIIPPGRREEVGTIRVAVDRVGAWWPAQIATPDENDDD